MKKFILYYNVGDAARHKHKDMILEAIQTLRDSGVVEPQDKIAGIGITNGRTSLETIVDR